MYLCRLNNKNFDDMKARTLVFFCAFVLCLGLKAFCVPAYPYPMVFTQSDKSNVSVLLKGDVPSPSKSLLAAR